MEKTRASVAMATYNGEKYIVEQIESILNMLGAADELVISDDGSNDRTVEIIQEYVAKDKRVRFVANKEEHGVCANFTNAVRNCSGDYIFMSDQDDVWLDDKINKMIDLAVETEADMVIHDGKLTDEKLVPADGTLFSINDKNISPVKNFIRGRFLGCCMCIKREMFANILPFPNVAPDFPHDIFATILVGIKGKIVLLDEVLIYHRIHERNVTTKKRNNFWNLVKKRMILLVNITRRLYEFPG